MLVCQIPHQSSLKKFKIWQSSAAHQKSADIMKFRTCAAKNDSQSGITDLSDYLSMLLGDTFDEI
jgi:hypothetical protein